MLIEAFWIHLFQIVFHLSIIYYFYVQIGFYLQISILLGISFHFSIILPTQGIGNVVFRMWALATWFGLHRAPCESSPTKLYTFISYALCTCKEQFSHRPYCIFKLFWPITEFNQRQKFGDNLWETLKVNLCQRVTIINSIKILSKH